MKRWIAVVQEGVKPGDRMTWSLRYATRPLRGGVRVFETPHLATGIKTRREARELREMLLGTQPAKPSV